MVDDGRDHGDDRRADDEENSRHYEQRRQPAAWKLGNGSLAKFAAAVAAALFLVGLVMKALGTSFTGSPEAIKVNTAEIAALRVIATNNAAAIAANTQAIAGVVATTVVQSKDIADIKSSINSLIFVNCAVYQKVYAGAPTISECVRTSPSP